MSVKYCPKCGYPYIEIADFILHLNTVCKMQLEESE